MRWVAYQGLNGLYYVAVPYCVLLVRPIWKGEGRGLPGCTVRYAIHLHEQLAYILEAEL